MVRRLRVWVIGLLAAMSAVCLVCTLLASPARRATARLAVAESPRWVLSVHRLDAGGLPRSYLLAQPAPAQDGSLARGSLPVLVVLHGRTMTPARMLRVTHFLQEVGRAIVVVPAGYGRSWNAGYCCGAAHAAGVNDVGFIEAVVYQVLHEERAASAREVYLAGFSNGGRMAYRMACDAPGMFAAVAAVEAVSVSDCSATTPVPLLVVAQTGDPLLTINQAGAPKHIEGHLENTVQGEVAVWRGLDGCGPSTDEVNVGDLTAHVWDRCRGRGRVEEAIYGGGAHTWFPGRPGTPSAEALVWSFFDQRPAGVA